MARGPTAQGARTRDAILRAAADLASVDGLEGLTIGSLAGALQISKSGLYAHFGSKQDLQLATIETARQIYTQEVITPARDAATGVNQLLALSDNFLSYIERGVFPGGCFFANAMAEFDCKPGAIRDRIAELQAAWMHTLQRAAADAVSRGQLRPDADVEQLAFEVEAALLSANWYIHLFSDTSYLDRAKRSIRSRVESNCTSRGRRAIESPVPFQTAIAPPAGT
jgi:AcrR family transcriptional regulator